MLREQALLGRCKRTLSLLYGDRLQGLLVYGSVARGTDSADSDIDLMVLLRGPVEPAREIRIIWDVLYPVQRDADRVISVLPVDADAYRAGDLPLYRNVHNEAVDL